MPRGPPTRYEIPFATRWPLLAWCRVWGLTRVGGPFAAGGTGAGSRWTWKLVVDRAYVRDPGLSWCPGASSRAPNPSMRPYFTPNRHLFPLGAAAGGLDRDDVVFAGFEGILSGSSVSVPSRRSRL